MIRIMLVSVLGVVLTGCFDNEPKVDGRWYTQSQLDLGKQVFQENCSTCHGSGAQGTKEWKKTLPNGKYPPPPLNGSAHAWHHPLKGLKTTVREGGAKFGGTMPGFEKKLSEDERVAAISYFQSKWSKDIYEMWLERGGLR